MKTHMSLALLCGLIGVAANAQTVVVEPFEYATDDELLAAWRGSGNALISMADSAAPKATGTKSMKVEFNFPSSQWATETVIGPTIDPPLSVQPNQYITFRYHGDPAFAPSDFHNLYLYVWDVDGNFARWPGIETPSNSDWQIANFQAQTNAMQATWDTTGFFPDLTRIDHFGFYQYGSQGAIDPYTATLYLDELAVRDAPLNEFPPPSAPRELLDNFETYADDAALMGFYSAVVNPPATTTAASLSSPAPQGNKALKLAIDFAGGQWPWGSVRSPQVAPFSFPTNGVLSVRFKGDPALAPVVDDGTSFMITFYDKAGGSMSLYSSAPVTSSDWTTVEVPFASFDGTSTVDTGNLVQWRILVQGWTGTTESTAASGTFYVDDLKITVPTSGGTKLAVARDGKSVVFTMTGLTSGKTYDLQKSSAIAPAAWSSATVITATSDSATWTTEPSETQAFYQLVPKP